MTWWDELVLLVNMVREGALQEVQKQWEGGGWPEETSKAGALK